MRIFCEEKRQKKFLWFYLARTANKWNHWCFEKSSSDGTTFSFNIEIKKNCSNEFWKSFERVFATTLRIFCKKTLEKVSLFLRSHFLSTSIGTAFLIGSRKIFASRIFRLWFAKTRRNGVWFIQKKCRINQFFMKKNSGS